MKNWKTRFEKHSEAKSWADRWGLRIAIVLALAAALSLISSIARAQPGNPERPELPTLQLSDCPQLDGIDADGAVVHFPRATADCMLARLRVLPDLVLYVGMLEHRIQRDDSRIGLRDREIELSVRQADVASENLGTALRRAREAEERLDAWYRQPVLLMGVGAVLVVIIEVVAIIIFAKVAP